MCAAHHHQHIYIYIKPICIRFVYLLLRRIRIDCLVGGGGRARNVCAVLNRADYIVREHPYRHIRWMVFAGGLVGWLAQVKCCLENAGTKYIGFVECASPQVCMSFNLKASQTVAHGVPHIYEHPLSS